MVLGRSIKIVISRQAIVMEFTHAIHQKKGIMNMDLIRFNVGKNRNKIVI